MTEVQRGGGRRWQSMYWLDSEPIEGVGDRIDFVGISSPPRTVDRNYEYRLIWDPSREMWRIDRRRSAITT